MEAVVGLLLLLLQTSFGVEPLCERTQKNSHCYGALGGSIFIKLVNEVNKKQHFMWKKNVTTILAVKNNSITINGLENRATFTLDNGIFRINHLKQSDSGHYELVVFNNGKKEDDWFLKLSIQAPVSPVTLSQHCLPTGEKKVTCYSNGDSPFYSWTLKGRNLTEVDLVNKKNNEIHLKRDTVGSLTCSATNNVSNGSNEVTLTTCGYVFINCTLSNGTEILKWVIEATNTLCVDPTTAPVGKESLNDSVTLTSTNVTSSSDYLDIRTVTLIGILLSTLVTFLFMALVVICVHKKKTKINEEQQDEHELTYAVVEVFQRSGRRVEHRSEGEVEYGQVKFSQQPRRIQLPKDDCVYAKVIM